MTSRYFLVALLVFFVAGFVHGQVKKAKTYTQIETLPPPSIDKDIIDVIIAGFHLKLPEAPRLKQKVNFSIMPISTATASGNRVLVSSVNVAFTIDAKDSTNLSTMFFLPYTDFYQNIGFGTKQNIWTARNMWNIPGELRLSSLAQETYGLGGATTNHDKVQLNYKNIRAYFTSNRKLVDYFFAGIGVNYDRYYKVTTIGSEISPNAFEKYGVGTGPSSFASGVTFNFLHDSRKNSINAGNSLYYTVIYRVNPTFLQNENQWTSIYADVRKYIPISSLRRKILAFWGYYWGAYGKVPYFNLPGTQLELAGRSGRGYSQARFRGKQMLYLESEYRFDISRNKLFGGVLFANLQSFTEPETNTFRYIAPAAGIGARIKFNKQSDTNLTLDFGVGKNSFNFYIGLGEFF
jgi:hypothetical protein